MILSIIIVNMNYQLTVRVVQNSLGNFETFTWKVLTLVTVFRFLLVGLVYTIQNIIELNAHERHASLSM